MSSNRPTWFQPIDALALGMPTLVAAALSIYVMIAGVHVPIGGIPLMWAMVVCSLGIWIRICFLRAAYLAQFTWYPEFGFMVSFNTYRPRPEPEFDGLIDTILDKWAAEFPTAEHIATAEINWVWFEPGDKAIIRDLNGTKVYGFTISGTRSMFVGYSTPDQPLDKTALPHEFGHIIYGNATDNWDGTTEHTFIKAHGLP